MNRHLWLLMPLVACNGGDTTPPPGDGDADTDTDSDTDADTDADTDVTGTTGDTAVTIPFALTSADMMAHASPPCFQQLPTMFWCTGQGGMNVNPEVSWQAVPAGTVSLALVLDDVSATVDHWGVYDIDPLVGRIQQAASGTNPVAMMPPGSHETNPYMGSCSNGQNTYHWRLFALDSNAPMALNSVSAIEMFAQTHTLGVAEMCHCPEGNCMNY